MSEPLLYNPALMQREALIASFIARLPLLQRLLDDLRRGSGQSHLVVGLRGAGKTSLLHRIAYAIDDDPELRGAYIPLVFPEEQYNVHDLGDFWLNCLDALADALRMRDQEVHWIDQTVDALDERGGALDILALNALVEAAQRVGLKLVLLVDNLDLVLNSLKEEQQWALRDLLDGRKPLLLIGASPTLPEDHTQYGKAFYDLLQVHELAPLRLEETREVLLTLSGVFEAPGVAHIVRTQPERIHALHALSGGSVRTVATLFNVLKRENAQHTSAEQDLDALIDTVSPLYKARLEDLSRQQQIIFHALCMVWRPCTAHELAEAARVEVGVASSQLDRLVKLGLVEKVPLPGKRKARAGFQVAERFFNIWVLVRAGRRSRRKVLVLTDWLRFVIAPDRVTDIGRALLENPTPDPALTEAMATLTPGPLAKALRIRAAEALVAQGEELPKELAEVRRMWRPFGGRPLTREAVLEDMGDDTYREMRQMYGDQVAEAMVESERLGIRDDTVAAELLRVPELAQIELADSKEIAVLEDLCERFPDFPYPAMNAAFYYAEAGQWEQALGKAMPYLRLPGEQVYEDWPRLVLESVLNCSAHPDTLRVAILEGDRLKIPTFPAKSRLFELLWLSGRSEDAFGLYDHDPGMLETSVRQYREMISQIRITQSLPGNNQPHCPLPLILLHTLQAVDADLPLEKLAALSSGYDIPALQALLSIEGPADVLKAAKILTREVLIAGAFGPAGVRWQLKKYPKLHFGFPAFDAALQAFANEDDTELLALPPEARPVADTFLDWMRDPIRPAAAPPRAGVALLPAPPQPGPQPAKIRRAP